MQNVFTLLPTKMISKTNINGVKIDYEEYLTELINNSRHFMSLTNETQFEKVLVQSHGEPDAVANNYEIDFKLLVNQEFVNAKLKSLPDVDYSNIKSGFICINENDTSGQNLTQSESNRLFSQFLCRLWCLKEDEIKIIENNDSNPLYSTIKMLKKEKNLLIFIPCVTNGKGSSVPKFLTCFFSSIFTLRDNVNKDTFVTLLCEDDFFYVFKYENRTFQYVDKVHMLFVPSFRDVYRLTYFLERN